MRPNEKQVLGYLNGLREKYNLGEPLTEMSPDLTIEQYYLDDCDVSLHCPVALALGVPCGLTSVQLGLKMSERFPQFVTEFMMEHDARLNESRLEERTTNDTNPC